MNFLANCTMLMKEKSMTIMASLRRTPRNCFNTFSFHKYSWQFRFFFFDAAFIIAISPLPFIFFRLIKVNWKLWQLLLRWIQLFGARSRVEQLIKVRIQYSVVTSYLLIREYFRQNAYKCYILYYSWRRVFFFFWKIISILQIICILKYFMQYNHNAIQMQYNAL